MNPNRIYSISFLSAILVCLVAPLLGTGPRRHRCPLLDLRGEPRHARRHRRRGSAPSAQFAHVQSRLADAAAAVDAARPVLDRDITEVELTAAQGRSISAEKRIRNRRGHATRRSCRTPPSRRCSRASVAAAGARSTHPAHVADGNAIAQHITLNLGRRVHDGRPAHAGLEPKGAY